MPAPEQLFPFPFGGEEERLAALGRLNVLDTPIEERFERITRLAAQLLSVPYCMVSLVDRDRVWFKSTMGTELVEVPRMRAFCQEAIKQAEVFIVPDATKDTRFADNALVKGPPHIRFYAGYPLTSPEGQKVGTLCVMDVKPREFGPLEIDGLRDLGNLAEHELSADRLSSAHKEILAELEGVRRKVYIDPVTRLWNREAILDLLGRSLVHAQQADSSVGVIFADVDQFKKLNDTLGHPAGDTVLRETGRRMMKALRASDSVGRFGGDEFLAVLHGTEENAVVSAADKIRAQFNTGPVLIEGKKVPVTVSMGATLSRREVKQTIEELVKLADSAMYRAKKAGRNRYEFDHSPDIGKDSPR